jgi:hypothetical protein
MKGNFTSKAFGLLEKNKNMTSNDISRSVGCSKRTAREILEKFRGGKTAAIKPKQDEIKFETQNDAATLESVASNRITTLEQLLKATQTDLRNWEVEKHVINTWENYSIEDKHQTLYQIKAWMKKKIPGLNLEEFVNQIKQDIAEYSPKWNKVKYKNTDGHLLEVSIFDLHYGKLCWEGETGENYDRKIAVERFNKAIQDLVERAKLFGIEKILFPIGNDFFNVDNQQNTTTAGTPQSEDGRWQKTFLEGKNLLVDAIAYLREVAPVDVILVPGNHDEQRSFYLATVLEAHFNQCKEISIDISPVQRKYIPYGKCLIGFSHGEIKICKYPLIMATEAPELWAKAKYREMHLGHLHHNKQIETLSTEDFIGVTVRHLSSLTGKDAWHNKNGFVGTKQSAEAFLWHKENGMVANFVHNL